MLAFVAFLKNIKLTANQLIIIVCSYVVLILNSPFLGKTFNVITELNEYDVGFLLSVPIFLLCLTLIFISVFTLHWLLKPLLIFLVLTSALIFYACLTYGVIFDYGMIQNTIETDSAEALTYVNFYALFFVLLLGVLPAVAIAKVKIVPTLFSKDMLQRVKVITVSLVIISIIAGLYYSDYASVGRNNRILTKYITPFSAYVATYKYTRNNYFSPPLVFTLLDTEPSLENESSRKSVTVLVVGETARASNFSLNGYEKNTNSFTEKHAVISFTKMTSCGTATAVSVPCMFSRLTKSNYNKRLATSQQNLLDIASLAGVDVSWIDNNSSCKGVCQRVDTIRIDPSINNENCDGEYCFDEALLALLSNKLTQLNHDNTLIVLHMIGSHGPTYYRRYPKSMAKFLPDCQRSDIQNCSQEELLNTYDNTIAYTDFVLSKIITQLDDLSKQQGINTNMLYVSDHGESLGENGVYLHGLPYIIAPSEQTHIPMLFWQSNYGQGNQVSIDKTCLQAQASKAYSHDNIFDSVLGLLSINSSVYNKESDLFSSCKVSTVLARKENKLNENLQTQ